MREFFAMGGYAAYVWSSFALTVLVLVWNGWRAAERHASVRREIRMRLSGSESHQGASIKEVKT